MSKSATLYLCLLVACTLSLASGCSLLGIGSDPFPWLVAGNEFSYDYYSVRDTTIGPDGERLEYLEDAVNLRFPDSSSLGAELKFARTSEVHTPSVYIGGLGASGLERESDGLYAYKYSDCEIAFFDVFTRQFLRVPKTPEEGDEFRVYECGSVVLGKYTVVEVNRKLMTAAGEFMTFVMVPSSLRMREYWSEEHGLIRVEYLDAQGRLDYYFELSSSNVQQR